MTVTERYSQAFCQQAFQVDHVSDKDRIVRKLCNGQLEIRDQNE
jgi:hypothetical protein